MPQRMLIAALCLCLAGCSATPAPLSPLAPVREHRLIIRPHVVASRVAQALVPSKTADDIAYLLVIPLIDPGDGLYHTLSKATGEPFETLDSPWTSEQIVHAGRSMPGLSFDQPLVITGLKAYGRYRLQAMAFGRDGRLISSNSGSALDLPLENDDAVRSEIPLPIQLVDTEFGAGFRLTISASGDLTRLTGVVVTIKRLGTGAAPPREVARIPLTTFDLQSPLQVSHLNAQTRYVIELEPQVSGEGGIPASRSFEVEVGQDDTLPDQTVEVSVPAL